VDTGCCEEGEKILAIPGKTHTECGTCSDFDVNCVECSATTCTKCKDGMFMDKDKGACVSCSELFVDCSQCNRDYCTECIDSNTKNWILTPDGCIPNDTVVETPSSSSSSQSHVVSPSSQPIFENPSSSSKNEDGEEPDAGMIVGIVIGCLVVAAIVGIVAYFFVTNGPKHGKINPAFIEEGPEEVSMSVL